MHLVVKFGNFNCQNDTKNWKGEVCGSDFKFLFFLFTFFIVMISIECAGDNMKKVVHTSKLDTFGKQVGVQVLTKPLKITSLERSFDKKVVSSLTENPIDYQQFSLVGQSEIHDRVTEQALVKTSFIQSTLDNESEENFSKAQSRPPTIVSFTKIDNSEEEANGEVDISSNSTPVPDTLKQDYLKEDSDYDKIDQAKSDENSTFLEYDSVNSQSLSVTTPKSTASPTIPLKPLLKSVRTAYPFLKKVPSRLIASQKPKESFNAISPTTKVSLKNKAQALLSKKPAKVTKAPRPVTPIPEDINPHHPHGIVVFDKRKRHPKPGRLTKPTTIKTTSIPSTISVSSVQEDKEAEESLEVGKESDSEETSKPSKPTKIPLSKLAMAMIASSANFDNGSNADDLTKYPKTPVNLLYLLQAYTKQLQLASSSKPVVNTIDQPIRIQSTPFMLQLSQLNYAAKLGISVYYSLIAIIPLIYLAFGGLGRLGFLSNFVGKKRRRKRSTNDQVSFRSDYDHGYSNRSRFNRKSHLKNYVEGGFHISRADLHDDDDRNEEKYAWILGKISEIIFEFSLLSAEDGIGQARKESNFNF